MVSIDDVRAAYRLILGREPESEAVLAAHAAGFQSVAELRQSFLDSEEFQTDFRRNFVVNTPPPAILQPADDNTVSADPPATVTFIQTCDPFDYVDMLAASSQTVREYCRKHGHSYEVYIGIKQGSLPWHACFNRIFLLRELWQRGWRGWVVYLDADALVADQGFDLAGYLAAKRGFAAVLTPCGWGPWWNINNGVMIFNYSHPWTEWFIARYYAMFMEHCYPVLGEAKDWGSIPHDQDLLQQILAKSELNRLHIFFEDLQLLNCTHVHGADVTPFIEQVLRIDGSVAERTGRITERVRDIVTAAPQTWRGRLLSLLSHEQGADPANCHERPHHQPRLIDRPPLRVETEATPQQIAELAARSESNWLHCGDVAPRTEAGFDQGGQAEIDNLLRMARRRRIDLAKRETCLELGCGAGELTYWLTERCRHVIAADTAKAPLELHRIAFERLGRGNIQFVHLASIDAFDAIPSCDLVVSSNSLHHNPPPLIALLLQNVLGRLKPGGIGYFRLPIYRPHYRFVTAEYLAGPHADDGGDIHLIPQGALFDIMQKCGCRVLDCHEDGGSLDQPIIHDTVLVRKERLLPLWPWRTRHRSASAVCA